jgi:uncharacterized RDD family membrane protein YckC
LAAVVVLNRLLLITGLLLAGAVPLRAAEPLRHDVLAQGDGDQFWVARVEQTPNVPNSLHTTIYHRKLGEEGKWQVLATVPAQVISLANQDGLAAALLADGSWMLLYADSGPFTAGSLPEPARMIALAGGQNTWWAIGVVPGGISGLAGSAPPTTAATNPAAGARPAATRPQTAPAENRLVLFSLTRDNWMPRAELPDAVAEAPSVSLAITADIPYLADVVPGNRVRVRRFENSRWVVEQIIPAPGPLAGFDLLSNSTPPRLWLEPVTGPDLLHVLNKDVSHFDLPPIADSAPESRAMTLAMGKLRMVAAVKGQLMVQDFGLDNAKPDGKPYELAIPRPSPLAQLEQIQSVIVTVALVIAIMGSFRQRTALKGAAPKLEDIALAPLGRRLSAGLIDLAPAFLAAAAAMVRYRSAQMGSDQGQNALFLIIYWSAGIFYVVYTTIIESVSGRSLGKLLMGLRVIGLDGQQAKPGALITRNVLRVIEVGLGFFPLLMILLFPLRQRAGDVAAGTLVVLDAKLRKEPLEEPAGTSGTAAS